MSWAPQNLFNLWRRSIGSLKAETTFTRGGSKLFQERWLSKKLMRAYHGDYINEKIFKRWYLPKSIPDVRPPQSLQGQDDTLLHKWAKKDAAAGREKRRKEESESKGLAPVGSLMFSEVERRIDVVIFRTCFAHSVYEARRMIIHGSVLLNGNKHTNANTRLAPGDMVTVDPKAIRFLQAAPPPKTPESPEAESEASTSDLATEESLEEEDERPKQTVSTKDRDKKAHLTPFNLPPYASPFIFIPAYLEPSFSTCSVIYLRHPTARPGYSEIPTPYDADGEVVRFTWEWYSRVRPRIRSKKQLARMPENRQ